MASSRDKPLHADNILPFKERTERDSLLGPRPSAPADTCRLAYCIFFLHGVGHLLPWNFFITAQLVRTASVLYTLVMSHSTLSTSRQSLPVPMATTLTVMGSIPLSRTGSVWRLWCQSLSCQLPTFGCRAGKSFLCLVLRSLHHFLCVQVPLPTANGCFSGGDADSLPHHHCSGWRSCHFMYVSSPLLSDHTHQPHPHSPGTDGFFAVTLLTVFLMNAASSIFQSSTFGFAGILPNGYTSAVMSGQVRFMGCGGCG